MPEKLLREFTFHSNYQEEGSYREYNDESGAALDELTSLITIKYERNLVQEKLIRKHASYLNQELQIKTHVVLKQMLTHTISDLLSGTAYFL